MPSSDVPYDDAAPDPGDGYTRVGAPQLTPLTPEESMNWQRFGIALGVAFLLVLVLDIILSTVILQDLYADAASSWPATPEANPLVSVGWLAVIFTLAAFGMLYTRTGWVGWRRGLEYGVWIGLAGFAGVLGLMVMVPWPVRLALLLGIQQLVNGLVLGLVFGVVYRPPEAAIVERAGQGSSSP